MVDLFPAIRLAQSILKRKFPFVDKPLKKGLWKIWAPGLISRILRYVGWSLWLLVGPLMPNRSKDDQTKCGPLVLRGGGIGGGGRAEGWYPIPQNPVITETKSRQNSLYQGNTVACPHRKWRPLQLTEISGGSLWRPCGVCTTRHKEDRWGEVW